MRCQLTQLQSVTHVYVCTREDLESLKQDKFHILMAYKLSLSVAEDLLEPLVTFLQDRTTNSSLIHVADLEILPSVGEESGGTKQD